MSQEERAAQGDSGLGREQMEVGGCMRLELELTALGYAGISYHQSRVILLGLPC